MQIEYECKFLDIDKNDMRRRLKKADAKLIYPEFMMKRYVWHFPKGHWVKGGWVRVRQEYDRITLSAKIVDGRKLHDQREVCIEVNDMAKAREILNTLGCIERAYQESKRELWKMGKVEITIDEWPFLKPFIEIEGASEKAIKHVTKKLGFDYRQAIFGSVDFQYADYYKISLKRINQDTPIIKFKMKNPFLKKWKSNLLMINLRKIEVAAPAS